jgi:uncharacterized protein with HEPN domain
MPRDPFAPILDMVVAIERAQRLAGEMSEQEFLSDDRAQWAVHSQIIILGEAAGRIDREFQGRYPDIPWTQAISMRHRLIHGYDTIDWERVWSTLQDDLPALLVPLKRLLPEEHP